jgi:hypothetical protein
MEGYHLWRESINESDPYEIINKLGTSLKIQDSKRDIIYHEELKNSLKLPGENSKFRDIFNKPGEI